MQIKTFRARTLRDALAMVRAEFGDGAALLHTREVNTGALARVMRGKQVEVAATPDRAPLAEQAAESGAVPTPSVATDTVLAPSPRNRIAEQLDELDELLEGFPESRNETIDRTNEIDPIVGAYARLIEADLAPALARDLIRAIDSQNVADSTITPVEIEDAMLAELRSKLSVSGPTRPDSTGSRVVALVGPTGVGKTTTLAKLAANARLNEGARVGLVTVDTYRVAAVDQLKTYAEVIDLPMKVVATPAEMQAAITDLADLDLVLIDTAGRSPRDSQKIDELRAMLEAASPRRTHLVLSVTATAAALSDAIERFDAVSPDTMLLTKLDEAPSLGHLAAPLVRAGKPVSYLTDGQNVPEDIGLADLDTLVHQLLGRRSR